MRSDAVPDLFSLAQMARSLHADLRPMLLRTHTQTFAAARNRDPRAARDFEAIALGLIPLVTDDVLAETDAMLRRVADAPASVTSALAARLGRAGPAEAAPRPADGGGSLSEARIGRGSGPTARTGHR